jgi:hypothetical protein
MNTLIFLVATGVGNPPAGPLQSDAAVAAKGAVKGGPPLHHTFELTHRGAGTLAITKVEAGCGCLRHSLAKSVLSPGESTRLTLEVNTLTQPDGPNRWSIAVAYTVESPGAPAQTGQVQLEITATLSREVSVHPPQLGFSTTGAASQVLEVKDTRVKPLTVLKTTTTSPHLSATIAAAGTAQQVTVKLAADAPVGHRDEAVVLHTDDPAYPELRIPVRVLKRAAGTVRPAPESISLRFAPGQTELATLVQLRASDGKTIAVASTECELPGVTVKHSTGAGAVAAVRVTVTETAAVRSGSCKVRVKLAQPAGEEIVIPVAWTVSMK